MRKIPLICSALISLIFISLLANPSAFAQSSAPQNTFQSPVDKELDVQNVSVSSFYDNVDGIYAKPLTEEMFDLVKKDSFFALANKDAGYVSQKSPSDLDLKSLAADIEKSKAAAALVGKLIKGPKGSVVTLSLYSGTPLKLFTSVSSAEITKFEISEYKAELKKLFQTLHEQLPFKGMVLSRRGQEVTVGVGSVNGLKEGMALPAIIFTQLRRHPKLQFITGSDREFIGRIRLTKVEPTLSFGNVELEKDIGTIVVGTKVLTPEFVKYLNEIPNGSGKMIADVAFRPDKDVVFGDNPQEWLPEPAPQYGKIEFTLGLSNYSQRTNLVSAGGLASDQNLAPSFKFGAELWLNTNLFLNAGFRQGLFSLSNPLNSSSPKSLNMSLNQYNLAIGYNMLLMNEYMGPKLIGQVGFMNTLFNIDDSTPTAFTNMRYDTYYADLGIHFPISETLPFDFGAHFQLPLKKTLIENKTSGSSNSNTIDRYGFYVEYGLKKRMRLKTELMFESFKSSFSGQGGRTDPATSTSHQLNTLNASLQYLF